MSRECHHTELLCLLFFLTQPPNALNTRAMGKTLIAKEGVNALCPLQQCPACPCVVGPLQRAPRMVDTEVLFPVFTACLSASITRSWKRHLEVRTKPSVISYFPEKALRTSGTGTGTDAIHHFYILFLLFLLNRTANKELDNLVPGLIRPKLSILPSFLLCRKLLVFFITKFSNIFLCRKSSLYAVVQENPGSQESCFL